jgi:hypothetical protein
MGEWYVGLGEIVVCWISEYGGWFGLWLCVIFISGVRICCRMNWKEYCFSLWTSCQLCCGHFISVS